MFSNPFTPSFGGKPDFFFGRQPILKRFDRALVTRGSADRVLFITGNRGCGKTALLEQLSQRAARRRWTTIDVNSEHALGAIVRHLSRPSHTTKTVAPEIGISVFGAGGSFGGISTSSTTTFSKEDVELIFLEACQRAEAGIFVSIDEVQKMALEELSSICGAFQMASRKGHEVMLAIAGLPYAYDDIVHYEGCTYMRRASHERLSVFTHEEARGAFAEAFDSIAGLRVSESARDKLVEASYGHPFFIQLAGYRLVERANALSDGGTFEIGPEDVQSELPEIIAQFEERSVAPVVASLPRSEIAYLKAMAQALGPDRTASTGEISRLLGKTQGQTSTARHGLLKKGVVVAVSRGKLMFNMPYLASYLLRPAPENPEPRLAREWGF